MDTQEVNPPTHRWLLWLPVFLVLLGMGACSKQVQLVRAPGAPTLPPLPPTENIRLVLPQDSFTAVPGTQLAYYHRGVTPGGPCNYKEILDDAVGMARTLGAHTARVVSLKAPDSYSSCYRIDVLYYR